jgi:DNA gyrase subunit A
MIITGHGKVIRVHSGEIREAGRSTQGVRLLRLDEGDRIAAAASILEEEEAVAAVTGEKPEGDKK